jgi:prepilin-type N-terminal cleavage/methylation domain-containing protein
MAKGRREDGFTLIELALAVGIVGILAGIAIPKVSDVIETARDARTKGNLGALRSALSVYYAETEGRFPAFSRPFSQSAGYGTLLHDTLVPNYLAQVPQATPSGGHHAASDAVFLVWNLSGNQDNEPVSGYGWTYDANPFDDLKPAGYKGLWGTVRVLCQHSDSRGAHWSIY